MGCVNSGFFLRRKNLWHGRYGAEPCDPLVREDDRSLFRKQIAQAGGGAVKIGKPLGTVFSRIAVGVGSGLAQGVIEAVKDK